jgi:hypothetical protein
MSITQQAQEVVTPAQEKLKTTIATYNSRLVALQDLKRNGLSTEDPKALEKTKTLKREAEVKLNR